MAEETNLNKLEDEIVHLRYPFITDDIVKIMKKYPDDIIYKFKNSFMNEVHESCIDAFNAEMISRLKIRLVNLRTGKVNFSLLRNEDRLLNLQLLNKVESFRLYPSQIPVMVFIRPNIDQMSFREKHNYHDESFEACQPYIQGTSHIDSILFMIVFNPYLTDEEKFIRLLNCLYLRYLVSVDLYNERENSAHDNALLEVYHILKKFYSCFFVCTDDEFLDSLGTSNLDMFSIRRFLGRGTITQEQLLQINNLSIENMTELFTFIKPRVYQVKSISEEINRAMNENLLLFNQRFGRDPREKRSVGLLRK